MGIKRCAKFRNRKIAFRLVNTNRHIEAPVVKLLVQNLGIPVQPAYARAIGSVDGQVQRGFCFGKPVFNCSQQDIDPLTCLC